MPVPPVSARTQVPARSGSPSRALSLGPRHRHVVRRHVNAPDRRQFTGCRDDRGFLAATARAHKADLMRGCRPVRTFDVGRHRPGIAMRARHQKPARIEHTHSIGLRVLPALLKRLLYVNRSGAPAPSAASVPSHGDPCPGRAAQCAPLRVQDVVQVTVLPWSQALQALTHWFMSRGLKEL